MAELLSKLPLVAAAAMSMMMVVMTVVRVEGANWCVARSDASNQALQAALDYACGAGADCVPILPNGLCYLPNTIQAHASYAFNSYFQKRAMAPGSCDFSGTATIARTDPSYGSCVYPSSASTAGGSTPTPSTTPPGIGYNPNMPTTPSITSPIYGGSGGGNTYGLNPAMGPPLPTMDSSSSKALSSSAAITIILIMHVSFWFVLSLKFPDMLVGL